LPLFLNIKFKGGLGNQLFQYATGRSICIRFGIPVLYFNVSEYKNESLSRNFSLKQFCTSGHMPYQTVVRKIFISNTKLNRFFTGIGLHSTIKEGGFILQHLKPKKTLLASLDGYWQSPYYFESIRKTLLKELQPLHIPTFPEWVKKDNTVAVHIRRTDYLNEKRYGFIGLNYYTKAMSYFREKLNEPLFVIFSDDLNWCREYITGSDVLYLQEKDWSKDYLELYLMSKCKHQIIANSSFSWWGAWLNGNENKTVIRPLRPFIDETLLYESHYPKEWISIQN
jgi:hypothetical protein